MPLGTKWRIEFETTEPIGDIFIEGLISDGVDTDDDGNSLIKTIKIKCLKELTDAQYKKHDEEKEKWDKEHGIVHGVENERK